MNEPFFGAVSPPWQALPVPPTGWLPSLLSSTARPVAGAASPLLASPLGLPGPGLAAGSMAPAAAVLPVGATIPPLAGSDVAVGVPVSALLATVAVRRGQPLGPSNDLEIEDFIYDTLEVLPGSGEVDVRCEGGRVALTGTVHNKRIKRDVGEIAWAIPGVNDVQNTIAIAARRRARGGTPNEAQAGRKSA